MDGALLLARILQLATVDPGKAPATLQEKAAPILMVAGVVLIAVMLVLSVRRRIAKSQKNTLLPRDRMEQIKMNSRDRNEVQSLHAEMVEAGTRIVAQIDARAERLEHLIRHADERLDLLDQEGDSGRSGQSAAPTAPPPQANPAGPFSLKQPATPAAAPASPAAAPPAEPRDALSREVFQLADRGLSALKIAQTLDEQVGKIELILALRSTGRNAR